MPFNLDQHFEEFSAKVDRTGVARVLCASYIVPSSGAGTEELIYFLDIDPMVAVPAALHGSIHPVKREAFLEQNPKYRGKIKGLVGQVIFFRKIGLSKEPGARDDFLESWRENWRGGN